MKPIVKLLILSSLFMGFASTSSDANAADLYLNLFRNPSIGPELKWADFSIHTGLYTTILSKNDKGEHVSTEFVRTGVTLWPSQHVYVSASHVYGITRDWKNKHGGLYEAGVQILLLDGRLAFRLGVAVLPSKEFGTKVNPTPGISIRFPF
ncbi:MAG TPA: hypothetical protein VE954_02340 [Oligoflexus sp.]|uniref:hypothetical protein n=1 Tax=Oligoflexus sp. TaxID=1971216 RepID=UPI002D2AA53F|nr:hypothetical protein [Oligoflexus sp.]HYX31926.1 hypothetical protein [Oligoflexus sp.]